MSGDKSKDIPKADRKEDTTSSDCLRHETFKKSGVTPAKTSAEAKSQTDRDCKAKLPQIELTNEAEAKAAKVKTIGLAALDTLGQITRESIRQEATATDSTSVLQPPNYVSGFDVNAFKDFMQTKSREERTAADHEFQAKFG